MNNKIKYKVAIIEPSPIIRKGIKVLLEDNPEFVVSACYCDYQSFQQSTGNPPVDIILINPAIINFYKHFAIRSLFPDCPDTIIVAIIYGYVDADTLNSFAGTLDIYDNGPVIAKKLLHSIKTSQNKQSGTNDDVADLSDREKEILVSIAKGMTNKEIADQHFISIHTVISHRKNITRKTGIKTVSGLTLYAMFNNLISQDDLL